MKGPQNLERNIQPIELRRIEAEAIAERRRIAIDADLVNAAALNSVKGLALSGGGIRSAFIARGMIEKLHELKLFAQFDYMSSVSGGGYTAAGVVDQICRRPTTSLFDQDYKLTAPPYSLSALLIGFLLDLLVHFVPFFALITLSLFKLVRGDAEDERNVLIIGLAISVFGFVVSEISRRRRAAGRPPLTVEMNVALTFMCFFLGAFLALKFGVLQSIAVILVCMFCSGRYVSANPHRFYRTTDPYFRWFFIGLSGVLSVALVLVAHQHPWSEVTLIICGVICLLFPWNWSLKWQNKAHRVFQSYRKILAARFLPQSEIPVKLHALRQSWNPYPIFNASANYGTLLAEFELTPHHCGSSQTGYVNLEEHMPDLDLADAMAISGSAMDFIRTTARLSSLPGALVGGTGYWVATQAKPAGYILASLNRLLTLVGENPLSAMQLSDGGFVENLGALALFKRRADLIVCLDAGYDPDFAFEDLRQLCLILASQGLATLVIPEMATACEKFRFRQNESNILVGEIVYPGGEAGSLKYGKYIHVKISGTRHAMTGKFKNFPHLPTLDQQLTDPEISALHLLGRELAGELAGHQDFNDCMH